MNRALDRALLGAIILPVHLLCGCKGTGATVALEEAGRILLEQAPASERPLLEVNLGLLRRAATNHKLSKENSAALEQLIGSGMADGTLSPDERAVLTNVISELASDPQLR